MLADRFWVYGSLCVAAFAAGAVNSIAGGGTLLTFPTLLAFTVRSAGRASPTPPAPSPWCPVPWPAPGAIAASCAAAGAGSSLLFVPSLLGGLVGALLLTLHRPRLFQAGRSLAAADRLAAVSGPAAISSRWFPPHPETGRASFGVQAAVVVFQFFVAVYGGYFGAGIGILMLTSLGFMGMGDIHRMNAVKTILAAVINGVSIVVFVVDDKVDWRYAPVMAVASILGGYYGAVDRPPHPAGDPARLRRRRRPCPGGVLFPEAGRRAFR